MKGSIIGILIVLFLPCTAFAQVSDHRNHGVDSLERILATHPPTGADLARIYNGLMSGYLESNTEKSMQYARECIAVAIPLDEWMDVSDGYRVLGINFYLISQYDSAVVYYGKALDASGRMRDLPDRYSEKNIDNRLSLTYGNMGNLYNMQGKYYEAIDCYIKALRIFEKHDWKESQSIAYQGIGAMYLSMDNYEQAKIYFMKLDSLAYIMGDATRIAAAKEQFSLLYLSTKEYAQALQNAEIYYKLSLSDPETGEEYLARALNMLSQIYLEGFGDETRAEEYARQALQMLDTRDIPREKSKSLCILSMLHLRRGEWRKAEQNALEALAADDSEPANTLVLYEVLAKVYSHLGNAAKANEYFGKHNELQSSWSSKHYQSAIREMEVKYETEKKETQIAALETEKRLLATEKRLMMWWVIAGSTVLLLALSAFFFLWRWTVQKRRHAEIRIRQLEQEKQLIATQSVLDGEIAERMRIARDLHDGLGSLLSAMRLNLENVFSCATLPPDATERFSKVLGMLDESTHEMRRVAHHLMPDALSRYGLKTALTDFCNAIPVAEFVYFGDEQRFDRKREEVVYRIAHELINNALKHSGASHILVQIVQEAHRIALAVEDDGRGFDPRAVTSGMGLQNVRTRVTSFGGTIDVQSDAEEGTAINVEFQL